MNIKNDLQNSTLQKEFWDSLQTDIIISNQKLTHKNLFAFTEQNFMFSLFYRSCSQMEMVCFQSLFHIEDSAYLILLELIPEKKSSSSDFNIDGYLFYHFLKEVIGPGINAIGPIICNRVHILISCGSDMASGKIIPAESISLAKSLVDAINKEYHISSIAGIGNVQNVHSIYTSFIEALTCIQRCIPGQVLHAQDMSKLKPVCHYDYTEAEKHMLDSIRLKKIDAYDYFCLMMDQLQALNDGSKRNKILEALILAAHAAQIDSTNGAVFFNYTGYINQLMELKGKQLIEWAFKRFMHITGFARPQNSIDYSNKIVQATKEYLEAHYAEDITLESMAEQVNINPQYFSKLIKKNTGFNFIDWLSMLRVKKAKELLTNSNFTVKEVCFMVGYKDPNYFSRIFKKRIGLTPSEYIKTKPISTI